MSKLALLYLSNSSFRDSSLLLDNVQQIEILNDAKNEEIDKQLIELIQLNGNKTKSNCTKSNLINFPSYRPTFKCSWNFFS